MPENVGVYFNDEEVSELLDPFDGLEGSRSEHIKRAMAVYQGVLDANADLGLEDRSLMELRQWVRYMLLEYERDRVPDEVIRRLTENG